MRKQSSSTSTSTNTSMSMNGYEDEQTSLTPGPGAVPDRFSL